MKQYFVDSNVFLRFFIKDDPTHSAAAKALFQKAKDGEITLFAGPPVFFEVAWVLKSFYKVPEPEILNILESMLAIPDFKVFDADYVAAAIDLARKNNAGFADSYIAAVAQDKNLGIATFNIRHLKKLGTELYEL
jgi:predicted nucleic acid-binding protein